MAVKQDLRLTDFVRSISNYPQPGMMFRDITPLLASAAAFRQAVGQMAEHFSDRQIDLVAAFDARGFVFAAPLAIELGHHATINEALRQFNVLPHLSKPANMGLN